VAGAADAALTASMGWVRPPFHPRSRHQRVLGGRRAQRHRVRDGRLTLGRCSDHGLTASKVPVGAIVALVRSYSQRQPLEALLRASGATVLERPASLMVARCRELWLPVGNPTGVLRGCVRFVCGAIVTC
jgi:hypothetical protein